MQSTPEPDEIQSAIHDAYAAAALANRTRVEHRGKKRPSRYMSVVQSVAICDDRARTLRRLIGMVFAHDLEEYEQSMKRAHAALERERVKLRKMW